VRRTTALLLLLCWAVFFAGLGRPAIGDSDEAFYAEAGREMAASGDWLTPHYSGQARFQKPILTYWLIAGAYTVNGVSEAGARLWSALAGLVLVLTTASMGRRWYDEATGRLGGAIVATGFGYFSIAHLALPDLPLAAFITLAVGAVLRAIDRANPRPPTSWLLAGLFTGLGLLTKGPIALVLVGMVAAPLAWRRQTDPPVAWRSVMLACLAAAAVALPWYAAMTAVHGRQYLEGFLVGDNLERFATARFNDPRPWWFYLSVLAGGLLPWTLLAFSAIGPIARSWREPSPTSATWRLTWWALGPLLFFTASVGKQPRYILPILPPLALLIARGILGYLRSSRRLAHELPVRAAGAMTGLLLVGLAWLLQRAAPVIVSVDPWLVMTSAFLIAAGGAGLLAVSLAGRASTLPVATAIAGALALMGLQFGLAPVPARDPVQVMAGHVRAHQQDAVRLGTYRVFVRNLVFYTHVPTEDLTTADDVRAFLASPERVLCVMRARDFERLTSELPGARRLADVEFLNASPVRLRALLSTDPSREYDRVALVTNR
jgi:4-amino-4-deoxy-L-arabinose transferase-like glycosyltransferase